MVLFQRTLAFLPKSELGDRVFSVVLFTVKLRYRPNLKHPVTYNDFMLKLKLSAVGMNPLREFIADKEYVKLYLAAKIGDEHNVPTLAVLRSPEEVDRFTFPPRCIIKPTHSSGQVILRTDEAMAVDRATVKAWFDLRYYAFSREGVYKHLVPKVIVEEFLAYDGNEFPRDYKFYCFHGEPRYIQVEWGRDTPDPVRFYQTPEWSKRLPTLMPDPHNDPQPAPKKLAEMVACARTIAEDFRPFIRVDMYTDERTFLVGEITNYPANCMSVFHSRAYDILWAKFHSDPALSSEEVFYTISRQWAEETGGEPVLINL